MVDKFNPNDRVQHVRTKVRGKVVEHLGSWVDWRPNGYKPDQPAAAMRTDISNLELLP